MKKIEASPMAETIRKAGLKATPGRIAILSLFAPHCDTLSVEEVFSKVKKDTDYVTVYRTLISFEKAGLLKKVQLHKGITQYELATHHHHHIVCTSCGAVEGFDACNIGPVTQKALAGSKKFSVIQDHSIELLGVCKSCVRA